MPSVLVTRADVSFQDREYWTSLVLISEAVSAFCFAPVFGYLLDAAKTRQKWFLFGLVFLLVSMALFTAASSIPWYIGTRILQGAANVMVSLSAFTIVSDTVPRNRLGQVLGYVDIAFTLGFTLGPMLGGIIYHNAGYYSFCGTVFGLIGVDFILRLLIVEKKTAAKWLSSESREGNDEAQCLSQHSEASQKKPSQVFAIWSLLQQPRILIATWAVILQSLLNTALDSVLPVFVEDTFHWNTFGAGLTFLPIALTVLFQPLCGYLSDRFGTRIVAASGFTLLTPSLICMRFVHENTMQQKILFFALLSLFGLFTNCSSPCLLVEMQKVAEEMAEKTPGIFGEKSATAQTFSIQQMAVYTGFTVGPILGGYVDSHYGWNTMVLSLGILPALTAVSTLWLSGPGSSKKATKD
ncbi:hypothetical protein N7510_007545 [Penicillium lagena]|uniref:uncharacterized protein n=1 Tax=Penicillium lagena TaxID=94218 RepID=UPI002541C9E4|nr:uncharacterized protein N7510_007545 [Penicillium lagena]KAJ5610826.1 hypothetical protein N7510_007545 [Penicillium lagena]